MPQEFPSVRTVGQAIETGVLAASHRYAERTGSALGSVTQLREMFPNIRLDSMRALIRRMDQAYGQALLFDSTGDLDPIGQLVQDPTVTGTQTIAFTVGVKLEGTLTFSDGGEEEREEFRFVVVPGSDTSTREEVIAQAEQEMRNKFRGRSPSLPGGSSLEATLVVSEIVNVRRGV